MPAPVPNNDCKLYYNSNTNASPTWVLLDRVVNVSCDSSATTAPTTNRSSKFETEEVVTVKLGPLTFDYQILSAVDADFNALRAAWLAKAKYQFAMMDGAIDTAGSEGWKAYFQITKCTVTEDDGGVRRASFEAVPTAFYESSALVEPAWLVVSA
jgi:hypothetical protein